MKLTGILLLAIVGVVAMYSAGNALSIITPDDRTSSDTPFVYVVGKLNNSAATHISVTVNDLRSPQINIKDSEYQLQFKDYFILDIELEEGENLIGVTVYANGKPIEDRKIILYYVKKGADMPKGVVRYRFHREEKEKQCVECHKIEKGECLDCHKQIIAKKYVHGPAGSGDCNVCHDFSLKNGVKYELKADYVKLCQDCHDNMTGDKFSHLHGPFASNSCDDCHNLHSSDFKHQLIRDVNELCKMCHVEFKSPQLVHVIAKHPTSDKKDPSRPGKPLQCSSCHDPHGAKSQYLFVREIQNRMELCKICHAK